MTAVPAYVVPMTKVLVGLSGGVDSAVAAYLLKKQGYAVSGCFMRNWDAFLNNDTLGNPTINEAICPQEVDYQDAQKVADKLGIPLYRHDYIKEYWDEVFANFIKEYEAGRTPNPDILCNKYIKFSAFLNFALTNGFDYIATGHYAKKGEYLGQCCLKKATDLNKDQSYFLAQITPQALALTLFPLAEITKPEVRRIAKELALTIADKKDSTGVCFIGERHFREFLTNYIPMKEGKIIDIETKAVIGKHPGVFYYTIGQRKGFGLGGARGPYYCVGKDVMKNELYLTTKNAEEWLYADSCSVIDFNHLLKLEQEEIICQAKFRYRQKDAPVRLKFNSAAKAMVYFMQAQRAVTEGQQAVFYLNDICLGGGVIDKVYRNGRSREEILQEYLQTSV